MSEQARRFNEGKPQYSLLDLQCLEPGVRVLEFGAKKYARDNWKKGMDVTKILDSLLRHIAALRSGELTDPESGLSHIGHIQCNALFLGNVTKNTLDIDEKSTVNGFTHEEKSGFKKPYDKTPLGLCVPWVYVGETTL